MHRESRFAKFALNKDKVNGMLKSIYCSLAYKSEKPVGFMMGVVHPMWFSNELAGYELTLYVDKDHRGGLSAVRLIKDFESYCKERGAKDVCVGSSAEISTDAARRLYTGLGFSECGFVAHKEI